jgi:hypothetical protein
MTEPTDFNGKIIADFRANGGKVGPPFEGAPMILVHHTGAKSGTERVTPLMYQQVGESYAIFADTTVEVGTETFGVTARVAEPSEREVIWDRQKERFPGFAEYEVNAAPRVIPVVVLDRTK